MESFLDCNFPELLAVDLETPGRISRPTSWTPKVSKTAIATERKKTPVLEELSFGAITCPLEKELLFKMKSLEILDRKYFELLALSEELMREASESDVSSSDSSGGVEPPSIRQRKLSITTPATSITSGRKCSTSAQTSPSTSPHNQIPPRSWLDFEEESPDIQQKRHSRTAYEDRLPTVSSPRQASVRYERRADSMRARGRAPEPQTADAFVSSEDSTEREDDTVTALPCHEQIPTRNRASSSRPSRYGNDNLRGSGCWDHTPYESHGHISPQSLPPRNHFIPSTDIIDETLTGRQPWLGQSRRKQPNLVPERCEYGDIVEDTESQDSQSVYSEGPLELPTLTLSNEPMRQHENIETWFQTVIDDSSHPVESGLEAPVTKLPLSADVLETLRVSVSCFPETMLLCSSLSIETIRSHGRKVKYESKCSAELPPVSQSAQRDGKSSKPSHWRRFTSLARRNHNETAPNTPAAPANFGLEEGKATWPDSSPIWVSIKNIFPNGTDYLCDALYAHLLTYNYIDSLCPRMLATTAPQPSRPPTARQSMDKTSSSGRQSSSNARIPRKAASILGLQYNAQEDASANPSMPRHSSQSSRSYRPSFSSSIASRSNTTGVATGRSRKILRKKSSYVISKQLGVDPGSINPDLPQQQQQSVPAATSMTSAGIGKHRSSKHSGSKNSTGINGAVAATVDISSVPRLSSAEQNLVDLRAGLSTCITRLIATLKTTSCSENLARAEGTLTVLAEDGYGAERDFKSFGRNGASARQNGEDDGSSSSDSGLDEVLVRSLCELVRISEGNGKGVRR